ncbi:hypothetical protein CARUB_v10022422mg [Capsella rubella]|uniref:Importin subunit alpha n=1 Tax=Capsella rubella TaxID=81985 RepID=R0IDT0_9BRAS|nr:hypothetical protein CARUB_v10022422mg [Capsella rubella]
MSLKPSTKTESRRNQYKVVVDAEEGRRRREDNMVEVRKIKREESLMKKRREAVNELSCSVDTKLDTLQDMVSGVWSDDIALQLKSAIQVRKLVSIQRNPPTDEVIGSGVVPRLVEFLKKEDNPNIQLEAAWALTNIASGTSYHTKVVVDHNAVPIFVQLLASSPSVDVREQAVWALGNVAGDSPQYREYVLTCGALGPLLNQLNEHTTLSMLREVTWTLSNLCRGGLVNPAALQALELLLHSTDKQVLADACWALNYITRLVDLLLHPSTSVIIPALRAVGNIVTGDDIQTQFVINSGALPCLGNLLTQNNKKSIRKEACWMISNITAGTQEQIQMVIEANLIPSLVNLLQCREFDIKKEAAWAISNVTSGSHDQIKYLVEQGCINPLCGLLGCSDPEIIIVCLKALENILKVGEEEKNMGNNNAGDMNHYAVLIEEAGGLDKMEDLENHDNSEIYDKAVKIMETYWLEEDDEAVQQSLSRFGDFKLV